METVEGVFENTLEGFRAVLFSRERGGPAEEVMSANQCFHNDDRGENENDLHGVRQQTSVINAIRAHLAEFGIVAPVGRHGVEELLDVVTDPNDKRVPEIARACLSALGAQLRRMKEQILEFDRLIRA